MRAALRGGLIAAAAVLVAAVAVLLASGLTVDERPAAGPDAGPPADGPDSPAAPAAALGGPEPLPFDPSALRAPPVAGVPDLIVQGSGWGHGVGMSQYGAQAQALAGRSHADILGHYYPGTHLGRAPGEAEHIRVNLFTNRGDLDRWRLRLRTSSRDGGPPDRPVEVALGDGDPVTLPWPQTWTLSLDASAGELVLTDNRGEERRRGPGPARVRYAFHDANPTLLRLPQLIPRTSSSRLSGTFAWGELEVDDAGGRLQPVMVLPLERYLYGIAEVPSRWEPAALAAQAVAARTYAVRQMRQPLGTTCRCHLGATPHHQVYVGYVKDGGEGGERWRDAVQRTTGEVLTYEGELAWTYYSSSHGGRSEDMADSWAYSGSAPYLRSVEDPWSLDEAADNPYAAWSRRVGNAEFAELVGGGLAEVRGVRVLERTAGDSPRVIEVRGLDDDGEEVRVRWDGGDAGSAATALKLRFRGRLPSQQITAVGLEPFLDDAGRPGEHEIVAAHRAGLLRGCDEGRRRVCPDGAVTRGELAVAVTRAAGGRDALEDLDAAVGPFDEAGAVAEAVDAGALEDCGRGCVEEPVSRAEAAAALAATLGLDRAAPPQRDAAGHGRADAIGAVHAAGLLEGCADGAFCPDEPLTRHDLAVALARAFALD